MLNDAVLCQFVPLNVLDGQFLSQAVKIAKYKTAPKGTMLFKRGKPLDDLFFLVEGHVDLISSDFSSEKVEANSERGQQALNLLSPTTVSAITKSPVTYLTINRKTLEHIISCHQSSAYGELREPRGQEADKGASEVHVESVQDNSDWMACLLQSPLFSRVPLPQLQELFGKFEKVYAKQGEKIVREGAKGDYFYVLAAGTALVTNCMGTVYLELKPGQFFGEEALITQAPRNATITMTSNGVLKRLSSEDFITLLKEPVLRYIRETDISSFSSLKILDVRLPVEYRLQHLPGCINVPLGRLRDSIGDLAHNQTYAISELGGTRAEIAAYLLCQAGFDAYVLRHEAQSQDQRQSA